MMNASWKTERSVGSIACSVSIFDTPIMRSERSIVRKYGNSRVLMFHEVLNRQIFHDTTNTSGDIDTNLSKYHDRSVSCLPIIIKDSRLTVKERRTEAKKERKHENIEKESVIIRGEEVNLVNGLIPCATVTRFLREGRDIYLIVVMAICLILPKVSRHERSGIASVAGQNNRLKLLGNFFSLVASPHLPEEWYALSRKIYSVIKESKKERRTKPWPGKEIMNV